jgi:K+-transporting ATPase ATPase A chain
MTTAWLELVVLLILLAVSIPFFGNYMAKVLGGERTRGDRVFGPIERFIFRVCGIDKEREQRWNIYALSLLAFSVVSILFVFIVQRLQGHLPFNPTNAIAVKPALAFNTAVSFATNTNWQNYAGETAMSHFTQMVALTVQNFASAAVGLTVAIALIRGLVRRRTGTLGNFWVDLVRGSLRILLPLAFVGAIVMMSQGVIDNTHGYTKATTVEGTTQQIPGGPFASQEAIKEAGNNGGGPLNANSAHPFENPNGVTNMLQMYLILVLPFSLTWTFGRMAKDRKQGYAVLGAMLALFITTTALAMVFEANGNPRLASAGANQALTSTQVGGNLEGKETRFGAATCGLYAAVSTHTSTGAVICAHDSLTPLGGMMPLVNLMFGEVSPGGVGAGLYGMLIFALLAVFIAGLMVGRTPEYLGKKIQGAEMKLVVIYILAVPLVILAFSAASVVMTTPQHSILNTGPHGVSEIVYAFTSQANNNGSAFGGLTGNTNWFNVTGGLSMLVGRYVLMIAALAIAGSLVRKQKVPVSAGTFPTNTLLFGGLLTGVVVIIVGLTYLPVLALGPIVEALKV